MRCSLQYFCFMNDRTDVNLRITSPSAAYDAISRVGPEHPCPYLPGKLSRTEAYQTEQLHPELYERLLGRGFRRSGCMVYRPRCRGCSECRQLRVPVAEFKPSRSQRRAWRRNADITVEVHPPQMSNEKYALFRKYLDGRHDRAMARSIESFQDFLYGSPTETLEFEYRLNSRLVGVSIADCCPGGLSSVYMYFDPNYSERSPGTFSVLWEMDYSRNAGLSYYYLGFFVTGCGTMEYKSRFRPYQVLVDTHRWLTLSL